MTKKAILPIFAIIFMAIFTQEIHAQKIDIRFMTGPMGGAWNGGRCYRVNL